MGNLNGDRNISFGATTLGVSPASDLAMKKLGLALLALMFLAPLVTPADAQVVVQVGHRHHYHHYHHRYYRH